MVLDTNERRQQLVTQITVIYRLTPRSRWTYRIAVVDGRWTQVTEPQSMEIYGREPITYEVTW